MAVTKRINVDYSIYAPTVTINGNLVVIGSTTNVESVNTFIYDNFITLAAGQNGGPNLDAGFEIDRGEQLPVGIRWHEPLHRWEYTDDGVIWKPLTQFRLIDDPDPHLGNNLIVNDFSITSDPGHDVVITPGEGGNLKIGPVIRVQQINYDPSPLSGYSTLYAKETKSGNTGFYIANEKKVAQELITKRKAFLYSIIL